MIAGQLEIQMYANMARLAEDMRQAKSMVGDAMGNIERTVGLAKTALLGLAGVASIGMFAGMIKSAIDAADRMNDLSTQTGAAVEALSALNSIGKLSGTGIDSIAQAMNKLSKNLAVANEESKGTGSAVKALGLDLAQFKALSPEDQMQAVAKAMGQFADGGGKAAVAMALYGKEGAKLLPFLKDLNAVGELSAKITKEQADMADKFNDNMVRIKASGEAWRKELAMGMLPALSDLSEAWLKATNGSGGLRDGVKKLSADGTLSDWVRKAVTGLTYLIDVGQGLISFFPMIGKAIAGAAASTSTLFSAVYEAFNYLKSGNMGGAWDALKRGAAGVGVVARETAVDISSIWNQQLLGEKIRKGMADAQMAREAESAGAKKQKLDFDDTTDAANKTAAAYEAFIKAVKEKIAIEQSEASEGHKLTESQKFQAELEAKLAEVVKKATPTQVEAAKALVAKAVALKTANEEQQKYDKLESGMLNRAAEALDAQNKKTQAEIDGTKAMRESTAEMLLTGDALLALKLSRVDDEIAIQSRKLALAASIDYEGEDAKAIRATIAALEDRKKAMSENNEAQKALKVQQQQIEMWKTIDSTAQQTFVSIFNSGKSAFDRLRDTLKNGLYALLYEITVKKWLISIAATVGGASGAAYEQSMGGAGSMLSGAGGAGNLISGASNMLGGVGNFFGMGSATGAVGSAGAGLYGSFATSSMGQAMGLSAMDAGAGAAFLTEAGATLGAALPWIGGAIAIATALGAFSSKGGPKTGGDAFGQISNGNYGAMDSASLAALLPNLGGNSPGVGFFSPDQANGQVGSLLNTVGASVVSLINGLGGSANGLTFGLGYDTDPQGTAGSRVTSGVYGKDGSAIYSRTRDVGRDADMGAQMAAETNVMILAAIKSAEGLPPILTAIASGIDLMTASADEAAAALAHINDASTVLKYGDANPLEDVMAKMKQDAEGVMGAWQRGSSALSDLISAYDGSAAATHNLAAATQSQYQLELQMIGQIQNALSSTQAMFGNSIESIRMSVMDDPAKYDYLRAQADALYQQLAAAVDPAQIQRLAEQINQYTNQAYGMLGADQKQGAAGGFIEYLTKVEDLTAQRLNEQQDQILANHNAMSAAITTAMDAAAAKMAAAVAAAVTTAANNVQPNPPVVVNVPLGSELGYA